MRPLYRSQSLYHLGLVAGILDVRGIGDVIDRATPQSREMHSVIVGNAVKAMLRNQFLRKYRVIDLLFYHTLIVHNRGKAWRLRENQKGRLLKWHDDNGCLVEEARNIG